MKKFLRFLILVFGTASLSSCVLPEYLEVYNNSPDPITFELGRGEQRFALPIGSGEQAKIGQVRVYDSNIRVTRNGVRLSYNAKYPGSEYWTYVGIGPFKKIMVRLQYDGDGRIKVLPRGRNFPVEPTVTQPQGYPLISVD